MLKLFYVKSLQGSVLTCNLRRQRIQFSQIRINDVNFTNMLKKKCLGDYGKTLYFIKVWHTHTQTLSLCLSLKKKIILHESKKGRIVQREVDRPIQKKVIRKIRFNRLFSLKLLGAQGTTLK